MICLDKTMAFTCIACKREIDPSGRNCPHCGEPITDFLRTYMVELIDGKYRIIERLGRGGMGEVYKVLHTRLGAIRVIKTMRPHLMEDQSLHERFLREAKLATRIQHQNVAVLHDFSQLADNSLYMVWEYIEGTNLAAMVRREGRLKPRVAIDIAVQTLHGLEAIHEAGIIHRDISPENIMVFKEPSGALRVKVIDLGIAKSEAVDGAVTRTGMFVGKWKYASPEHLGFLPEGQGIDGRADLFSFGIVLYEMLSGRAPYEATTPGQYFILHSKETPNPVTLHNLSFPEAPGLEKILARALEKDREQRYPTAKEFAKALSVLLTKLEATDLEQTAVFHSTPGSTLPQTAAGIDSTAPIPRPKLAPTQAQAPVLAPTVMEAKTAAAAPPVVELAATIAEKRPTAPPPAAAARPSVEPPLVKTAPVGPQPTARPKSSPAMIAAAVIVVALGLGLVGAGLYSVYKRWQPSTPDQTAATTAAPGATDAATGGAPATVAPPEGRASPPATAAATQAQRPAAQPPITQPSPATQPPAAPPVTMPPPASQTLKPAPTQTPASQAPAIVAPPPPTAPPPTTTPAAGTTKPPVQATPPAGENLPATIVRKTPLPANPPPANSPAAKPPAAGGAPPATGGVSPAAAAAAAGAATAPKPPPPGTAAAGDLIPDAGSLGWRSKALTASAEWKSGFQRGIIKNYEDMYSGSPANWAAVAPGVKLSTFKIVVGRLLNLSGLDRPQITAAFPAGLQTSIDGEVGTKGTVIVSAQVAVVAAVDDDKQGRAIVVEVIFRDPQGKILAKLHHRTEGRDFDGAVEDMVTELTDFVVDHPVVSVKKVK
jgi:serine/threonine protein kinase